MTDWQKLCGDLSAARLAAATAADAAGDGGSCNTDNVRLFGLRWSKGLRRALEAAGVTGYQRRWLGSACVELWFGFFGQAGKNYAAVQAASKLLTERGWEAAVFYQMD